MKHCFKPVPSTRDLARFFAQCSISQHLVMAQKSTQPMEFENVEAVEKYSLAHTGPKLAPSLFKSCAQALLLSHGAELTEEVPSHAGVQKEFTFQTICGPALVVPLEDWVIFRFLEPDGKRFPWPMSGDSGKWNIHVPSKARSVLLLQLEEQLLMAKIPAPEAKAPTQVRDVLPPCVMKSQAGFYVGCYVRTEEGDYPHSRFSDYFKTKEKAADWLKKSVETCSL